MQTQRFLIPQFLLLLSLSLGFSNLTPAYGLRPPNPVESPVSGGLEEKSVVQPEEVYRIDKGIGFNPTREPPGRVPAPPDQVFLVHVHLGRSQHLAPFTAPLVGGSAWASFHYLIKRMGDGRIALVDQDRFILESDQEEIEETMVRVPDSAWNDASVGQEMNIPGANTKVSLSQRDGKEELRFDWNQRNSSPIVVYPLRSIDATTLPVAKIPADEERILTILFSGMPPVGNGSLEEWIRSIHSPSVPESKESRPVSAAALHLIRQMEEGGIHSAYALKEALWRQMLEELPSHLGDPFKSAWAAQVLEEVALRWPTETLFVPGDREFKEALSLIARARLGQVVKTIQVEQNPAVQHLEKTGFYLEGQGTAFAPVLALLEVQGIGPGYNFAGVVKTEADRDRLMAVVGHDPAAQRLIQERFFVSDLQQGQTEAERSRRAEVMAMARLRIMDNILLVTINTLRTDLLAQLNDLLYSFGLRLSNDPVVQDTALTLLRAA